MTQNVNLFKISFQATALFFVALWEVTGLSIVHSQYLTLYL